MELLVRKLESTETASAITAAGPDSLRLFVTAFAFKGVCRPDDEVSSDNVSSSPSLSSCDVSSCELTSWNTIEEYYYLSFQVPDTAAAWQRIADEFEEKWDFPNCIGAIDGKHVVLRNPPGSGSTYFNYKGHFSIVLLAIVDADYNFVYVDVGRNGRTNDAGVFSRSPITELLENRQLNIPQPKPLPGRRTDIPYVLVGDDAFPLKDYLMKPYPNRQLDNEKRIFNYRLSRARRIVENVFGIMSSRFGVFQKALPLDPEIVTSVVLAACVLHNFLRSKSSSRQVYSPDGTFDKDNTPGEWRANVGPSNMENFVQQGGNRNRSDARGVRDEFCDYFNSNGQVPWQWDVIHIPDW